jgi:hypothetical protein
MGENVGNGAELIHRRPPGGRSRGWSRIGCDSRPRQAGEESQVQEDRHRAGGIRRQEHREVDLRGVRAVADLAQDVLPHGGSVHCGAVGLGHRPSHLGRVRRDASENKIAVELQDLRAALLIPHLGILHRLPVVQDQRIGQDVRAHLGFIVIRDVPGPGRAADGIAIGIGAGEGGRGGRHVCGDGGGRGGGVGCVSRSGGESQTSKSTGKTQGRGGDFHGVRPTLGANPDF